MTRADTVGAGGPSPVTRHAQRTGLLTLGERTLHCMEPARQAVAVADALHSLPEAPLDRVHALDELILSVNRNLLSQLGDLRREAVADLVRQDGVTQVARTLGISRTRVYKLIESHA